MLAMVRAIFTNIVHILSATLWVTSGVQEVCVGEISRRRHAAGTQMRLASSSQILSHRFYTGHFHCTFLKKNLFWSENWVPYWYKYGPDLSCWLSKTYHYSKAAGSQIENNYLFVRKIISWNAPVIINQCFL